jgi:hypothetical protein
VSRCSCVATGISHLTREQTIEMKKKNLTQKTFTPMSAVAAGFALAAVGAQAQTTPVFTYGFPASWNGTGTTITDQSSAGNNGTSNGTIALAPAVPPGAAGGTESLSTVSGGIVTGVDASLANSTVAAAGGFTYNVDFLWNGTDSSSFSHTQKLIDYAGTESLQLTTTTGSATLGMSIGGDTAAAPDVDVVSTTILPNTWYDVTMTFNTEGNSLVGGDISGVVDLYVNGSLVSTAAATKGTYGDSLDRPIGIGELPVGTDLVGFKGDIYAPSVELGVAAVPEPSSTALGLVAGLGGLGMIWKARRRKA